MKSWTEKEEAYEDLWRSNRQANDLWKYIPKSCNESVAWANVDSDGYWIYLNEGWVSYDGDVDCGTIHEYTIADLKSAIKEIRRKGEKV